MITGGIDESCKGQVLNNLVVCVVYTQKTLGEIPYYGESKTKVVSRSDMRKFLRKNKLKYFVLQWPPKYVDRYNLNYLLYIAQIFLIKRAKCDTVYVDSIVPVGKRLDAINKKYRGAVEAKVICAPKLDKINSLVGLASLIAYRKKTDNLKQLERVVGCPVGSGNITDPVTGSYIRANYPNVPTLRKSWPLDYLNIKVKKPFEKSKFI